MNPFFVFFAALFFSSTAFAYQSSCTAEIVSERGITVATFVEYDYSYQQACWQAERSCQDELWQRQSRGQNRFATCQVANNFPPQRAECNVDLYNGRHMLVTSFWAQGYTYQEACNEAYNRCYDEQRWRQDLGSYCQERFASPPPRPTPPLPPGPRPGPRPPAPRPPQQISASCSVNRLEMNNRVAQIHQAQAWGRTQNEAKAQACNEAMRNCQRARTGRQVCQQGR